jgi:hypothetical protein
MSSPIDKRNRLLAEEREKLKRAGDPYAPLDGDVFDQEQMEETSPRAKDSRRCVGCGETKPHYEFNYHGQESYSTCRACQRDQSRKIGKYAPPGIALPEGTPLGGML